VIGSSGMLIECKPMAIGEIPLANYQEENCHKTSGNDTKPESATNSSEMYGAESCSCLIRRHKLGESVTQSRQEGVFVLDEDCVNKIQEDWALREDFIGWASIYIKDPYFAEGEDKFHLQVECMDVPMDVTKVSVTDDQSTSASSGNMEQMYSNPEGSGRLSADSSESCFNGVLCQSRQVEPRTSIKQDIADIKSNSRCSACKGFCTGVWPGEASLNINEDLVRKCLPYEAKPIRGDGDWVKVNMTMEGPDM